MYLDLGSGQVGPRDGYEGVDKFAYEGVKWLCDLEKLPWVFYPPSYEGHLLSTTNPDRIVQANSVESINCSHLVEHVKDLVGFMSELWRVCKDGAEVHISHPYQFNLRAWQDPTHVRCLNERSFFYFDKEWRQERDEFGSDVDFEVVDCIAIPDEGWETIAREMPEEFEKHCRNMINVVADLQWILRVRK